ncbi:MAG: hypothetical protein ACYDC1_02090 [Limisphaerales bacterium]
MARSSRLLRPGEIVLTRPLVFPSLVLDDRPVKGGQVLVVYPGPDSFEMDPAGRFVAMAWRDLSRVRQRIA